MSNQATPPPVDLNRLKNILGSAKSIMNKVETGDYQTGNIDPRALTEEGVNIMKSEGITRPMNMNARPSVGYDEETVKNSRLPESVKKVMLERPIPQLTNPNYTFSLNDVADLADDKPMGFPKTPKTNVIRESVTNNSGYVTVSKQELNEMVSNLVNEKLLEFFTKNYNKMVTEDAVKKTISMLVKEGKLTPKKKIV